VIRVRVALALPQRQEVLELELPEGSTVGDAIAAARLGERFPGIDAGSLQAGIWSRVANAATVLREGDRVELYRALKADPKDARRERARLTPSTRSRNGP
jgi:putative ubiquitin-RnfH superfamily antitoxin RatB of RatAB toxin-antitoxin module